MELVLDSIHDVIHPTAAYAQTLPYNAAPEDVSVVSWEESQLNPKNRIDSLDPPENPLWAIDGCMGLGTQYFARPLFLGDVPPMSFHVFIPEEAVESPDRRELLDLNMAFHTRDGGRVSHLAITAHILRTLQAWTKAGGEGGRESIADMYKNFPYGSRIIFENLDTDVRRIKITPAPFHDVERQLFSSTRLASLYKMSPSDLPKAIDIFQLRTVRILQDSVILVRVDRGGVYQDDPDKIWILKALTSGFKYLYTELRNLLRLEPHSHIISKPDYLVTKLCRFGNKEGVVGFLLEYHPGGGIRDEIPLLRIHNQLELRQQLKWSLQLTKAVLHVRERCHMFYPDLRLDNVVLSKSNDIVMIDFEQRGVWCEFGAPEINTLEYMRLLASDGQHGSDDEPESVIPEEVRERYARILSNILPDWEAVMENEEYGDLPHGWESYNIPWLCLSPREQETAEVYMLGRVLWCLFEGQCAPQRAAVWQSYKREPPYEFPEYHKTPPALRDLIERCTRGRRDVLSQFIVRQGSKLVLRAGSPAERTDAAAVQRVAREWWQKEIKDSEEFVEMREQKKKAGQWNENHFERPSLQEVLAELEAFKEQAGIVI